MAIIWKIFGIRFTLKSFSCELSSFSYDISGCEEKNVLFLQLAVMFKMKKEEWEEKKIMRTGFFFLQARRKGAFNNLTRNETSG